MMSEQGYSLYEAHEWLIVEDIKVRFVFMHSKPFPYFFALSF